MPLVIVSGALANKPFNGGNACSRLGWLLGFQKLGFEICFLEQIARDSCVDASGAPCPFRDSVNLSYFKAVMAQFGVSQSSALLYRHGEEIHGLDLDRLVAMAERASLLLNMSGHLCVPEIISRLACKVYLDDDPGFTQFWDAAHNPGARLWDHDFYFTVGENIGKPDCPIPRGRIPWRHTRPPVMLDHWPAVYHDALERFTTVASWRGAYGPIQHAGKTYGLKVHEFRKFIDVPQRNPLHAFEVALQIHPADQRDREALLAHGWRICDPVQVADSPYAFRKFIQGSSAEFSVSQGIYVETGSGWFSDRTVRYLASGKPALIQDTGWSRSHPAGDGLLFFRNKDDVDRGVKRLARDYQLHCQAARRLAEQYFDSDKVISDMASEIGLTIPPSRSNALPTNVTPNSLAQL